MAEEIEVEITLDTSAFDQAMADIRGAIALGEIIERIQAATGQDFEVIHQALLKRILLGESGAIPTAEALELEAREGRWPEPDDGLSTGIG